MDFYALYPCTITDLEAVKAAEKKENVYCEHLKERIRRNNEEELDGQFFHGITRINLSHPPSSSHCPGSWLFQ